MQPLFLAANCLSYFCLAGNFAMMPPAIQRMFGPKNGALIYGLIYTAFGTASLATILMSKVITIQFTVISCRIIFHALIYFSSLLFFLFHSHFSEHGC